MRIPSQPYARQSRRAAPSTAARPTQTAPPAGGTRRKPGVAGRPVKLGHEVYLWVLVVIEVALIGGFRKFFRRFHGG